MCERGNVVQFPGANKRADLQEAGNVQCLHPSAKSKPTKQKIDFRKLLATDLADVGEMVDGMYAAVPNMEPLMCQRIATELADIRMRLADLHSKVSKFIPQDKEPA